MAQVAELVAEGLDELVLTHGNGPAGRQRAHQERAGP
jgi:carbamate kinase